MLFYKGHNYSKFMYIFVRLVGEIAKSHICSNIEDESIC